MNGLPKSACRVSVVLATWNGEAYLAAQLDSISRQTRRPDEVLIGDDGSSDGTLRLLEGWAASQGDAPNVRVIRHARRMGSTGNFAALLGEAAGDVVFLSDQDDVWRADRIAHSLAVLDATKAAFVFSDARIIDGQGRLTGETLWGSVFFSTAERALFRAGRGFEVLLRHNVVTGATMALRREVLRWVLPVEGHWVHDGWIALIAAAVAEGVALAEPLIDYRRHQQQQIGATGRNLARVRRFIEGQDAERLAREAQDHRALAARLRALATAGVRGADGRSLEDAARAVEGKAEFLATRASWRARPRPGRLLQALTPTGLRGYRRFSLGAKTVVVDLLAGRS